jgi:hypothetical protein
MLMGQIWPGPTGCPWAGSPLQKACGGGGHWPVDPENASDKGGGGGILGHEAAAGNRFQAEVGSEAHQMRCSLAARVGKGEPAPGAWIVGHRHRFARGS